MNAVVGSRPLGGERGAAGVKVAIVFVVVAAVLAGAFFVIDRYAHGRVEREAAAQLQTELGTPGTPTVRIVGTPFLTQVVARDLHQVRVVADDVGSDGSSTLPVEHVDLTLYDVRTSDWWQTMTADRAEGYALISHNALIQAAGVPLSYVGNGRYTISESQTVFGQTVTAKVTGGLALDQKDQTVALSNPTVEVANITLPDVVADQLIKAIVKPIPLEGVPLGLQVSSLAVQDDGLHAGIEGTDIALTR